MPSYVFVVNTNHLQIIPNCAYEYNNASWSLNSPNVAINFTIEIGSSANSYPYGGFTIGNDVNYPPQILNGNYKPASPYGIVVVLDSLKRGKDICSLRLKWMSYPTTVRRRRGGKLSLSVFQKSFPKNNVVHDV